MSANRPGNEEVNARGETPPNAVTRTTIIMGAIFLVLIILAALMFTGFFRTLPSGGNTANTSTSNVGP